MSDQHSNDNTQSLIRSKTKNNTKLSEQVKQNVTLSIPQRKSIVLVIAKHSGPKIVHSAIQK